MDKVVIIPTYNAAAFVEQALASLAAQTRSPAAVVVADDASTDDTVERVLRWKNLLPLQVVRLERNVGPGQARHQAILATNEPLLAILDADDVMLPDHLEVLWAAHEKTGTPVTLTSCREWDWIPHRGIDAARRRAQPRPIPSGPTEQILWVLRAKYLVPAEGFNKVQGKPFKVSEIEARIEEALR